MAESADSPLTLMDLVQQAHDLGVAVVQICDYPQIETWSPEALAELKQAADGVSIRFELGTRGVERAHLSRYLKLASILDVSFVRTMIKDADTPEARGLVVAALRDVLPEFIAQGVTLGLETYEQVASRDLLAVVEAVDSPSLGICLDPANCVARLEHPNDVVARLADHVLNIHVKDFDFVRQQGLVGFMLMGCPLGEGLLDYDGMIERVQPEARGINQVIEHWLPWQGTSAETCRMEQEWTLHNINVLRSKA